MQHTCLFYAAVGEAISTAAELFKKGSRFGERCIYVAPPGGVARARKALMAHGLTIANPEYDGDVHVLDARQVYLRGGSFSAEAARDLWRSALEAVREEGRLGLCCAADAGWIRHWRVDDLLLRYESEINRAGPIPVTAICMVPRRGISDETLRGLLCAHPWVVAGGERRPNPFYVPPDQFGCGLRVPTIDAMLERLGVLAADRSLA